MLLKKQVSQPLSPAHVMEVKFSQWVCFPKNNTLLPIRTFCSSMVRESLPCDRIYVTLSSYDCDDDLSLTSLSNVPAAYRRILLFLCVFFAFHVSYSHFGLDVIFVFIVKISKTHLQLSISAFANAGIVTHSNCQFTLYLRHEFHVWLIELFIGWTQRNTKLFGVQIMDCVR